MPPLTISQLHCQRVNAFDNNVCALCSVLTHQRVVGHNWQECHLRFTMAPTHEAARFFRTSPAKIKYKGGHFTCLNCHSPTFCCSSGLPGALGRCRLPTDVVLPIVSFARSLWDIPREFPTAPHPHTNETEFRAWIAERSGLNRWVRTFDIFNWVCETIGM